MPRPKKDTPEGIAATKKWRETMTKKYGSITERQKIIGAKGGKNGRGPDYKGGFASNSELARKAGAKGGSISKRGQSYQIQWDNNKELIKRYLDEGYSMAEISRRVEIPYPTLMNRINKGFRNK